MDFDFNIILVPITLIFGVIWLVDKLWLKQHRGANTAKLQKEGKGTYNTDDRAVIAAQAELNEKRDAYAQLLQLHGIEYTDDTLDAVLVNEAPVEVQQAQRNYRGAKRELNIIKNSSPSTNRHEHFLIRWAHDYFPVLAVVLIVRSFIIEPFNIPSPSMVPALYTGDFVAVNKYAYGLRLPLIYKKVIDVGAPKHGDVAVFRYPENPKIYYIKRVIGLPGDTVSFDKGHLAINGEPVATKQVNYSVDETLTKQVYTPQKGGQVAQMSMSPAQAAIARAQREESAAHYYQEKLGEHTYLRRYLAPSEVDSPYSRFLNSNVTQQVGKWQVTVPKNHYFVMGDNSDRSGDGRFWGFVPDENLAGKATYVWMHKKPGLWNLPTFAYNRSIS